jgi:hypothetical protein
MKQAERVNLYNCIIWGSEIPHTIRKGLCKSECCALSCLEVLGPFFFAEQTLAAMTYLDMLQLCLLPELEDHQPDMFEQDGAPHIELVSSKNFLTYIFLGVGLGMMDQFCGLHTHPILHCLSSSYGDTLRTLFARPLCPPQWTEAQNCCCGRNSYTANAGERLEGNCIPLGHLTWHNRRACWSCLAFCSIDSTGIKLHFHIL